MDFDKPNLETSDDLLDQLSNLSKDDPDYETKKAAIMQKLDAARIQEAPALEEKKFKQQAGLTEGEEMISTDELMAELNRQVIEKMGDSGEKLLEVVKGIISNVDKLGTQLAKILVLFDGDGSKYYQQQSAELSKELRAELSKLKKEDVSAPDIKAARIKSQEIHSKYQELVQRAFLELKNRRGK